MKEHSFDKTFVAGILLITSLAFILRIWGLSSQPLTGDDVAVAFSAMNFMERGQLGPTMWNHPHLRDIAVYGTMQLFGRGVWGVKSTSLLLGTLSVPFLGLVTRRLFGRRDVALLASFLLAVDSFHIDYSRQGVHEIYMAFFTLCAIWLSLKYLESFKLTPLMLSGVVFGLGIASKWYVAFPMAVTWLFVMHGILRGGESGRGERISKSLFASSALTLIPGFVYLLSFIPWFQRGYDLSEWLTLQKAMLTESAIHTGYNRYQYVIDHNAWLWFLKPVAYVDVSFGLGDPTLLLAIANPVVWLLTLPSLAFLAYRAYRERRKEQLFVLGLFWLTYLQFLVLNRPMWAHTAFAILPFALMAVAYLLIELRERKPRLLLLPLYLVLVVVTSAPLYLLATGRGGDNSMIRPLLEMYRPPNER